jgi:hypothetical protein
LTAISETLNAATRIIGVLQARCLERNVKRSTMVCSIDRERVIFEAKPMIRCAASIFFVRFRFLWQFLRFHVIIARLACADPLTVESVGHGF